MCSYILVTSFIKKIKKYNRSTEEAVYVICESSMLHDEITLEQTKIQASGSCFPVVRLLRLNFKQGRENSDKISYKMQLQLGLWIERRVKSLKCKLFWFVPVMVVIKS